MKNGKEGKSNSQNMCNKRGATSLENTIEESFTEKALLSAAQICRISLLAICLYLFFALEQGCAERGRRGRNTPNIFKIARKLIRNQPCCKGNGHKIFCDIFLVTMVCQVVKKPPPQWKVPLHISALGKLYFTSFAKTLLENLLAHHRKNESCTERQALNAFSKLEAKAAGSMRRYFATGKL